MAYRFDGDQYCRAERFAAYAAALGDRFTGASFRTASRIPMFHRSSSAG
jgi:hypothetical protein